MKCEKDIEKEREEQIYVTKKRSIISDKNTGHATEESPKVRHMRSRMRHRSRE